MRRKMRFIKSIIFSLTILCSFLYSQEVKIGLGAVTDTSAEITMDTPFDVGGFQFNAVGANVTSGSGGLAADAGFFISAGGETVLGFSFSGGFIPAGSSGILTNLSGTFPDDLCLSLGSGAISDTIGGALPVTFGEDDCDFVDGCDDLDGDGICDDVDDCVGEYDDCGECNGDGSSCTIDELTLSIGNYFDDFMEILMETPYDVGGFQFDVVGANVTSGSGGLAADAGFTVSTGGETVLGFSFSGGFIPAGSSGVLTNLSGSFPGDSCLANAVISDTVGGGLDVLMLSECEECDDADNDGICDGGRESCCGMTRPSASSERAYPNTLTKGKVKEHACPAC